MITTKISAASSYHPPHIVEPSEIIEEAKLESIIEKDHITTLTGIKTMHHGPRDARPSTMAIPAVEKVLQEFDGEPSEIDLVIFCGMNRDMQEPSTAHIISHAVGISPNLAFDVSDACHGLAAGMIVAEPLVRSGAFRNALLCTGETPSHGTQHIANRFAKRELGEADLEDNIGAFTVGDAGGAIILSPTGDGTGFQPANFRDDQLNPTCFHSNAKSSVWPACFVDWESNEFAMHMKWISAETIRMVAKMAPSTLSSVGKNPEDVDMFIAHQVGKRVHDSFMKMIGIKEGRTIETYPDYGNITSVTFPTCWELLNDRNMLEPGSVSMLNLTGSGIVTSQAIYVS